MGGMEGAEGVAAVRGVALPWYDGARLAEVRSDIGLSKVSVGQRPAPRRAALLFFSCDPFFFFFFLHHHSCSRSLTH